LTNIYGNGEFHIESLEVVVTVMDAAGRYFSGAIPFGRAGRVMGFSATISGLPNNDNGEAIGGWEVRTAGGGNIAIGSAQSSISVRVNKQAGTSGNSSVTFRVIVFVRN